MSSVSAREEQRLRKEERMNRDRDNTHSFGSYATGKGGYEVEYFKPTDKET